jgi:sugar-specific transcriptional regulator TrmB
MDDTSDLTRAIELLQQLGLKEYEAKSFVALTRRERGTAKDISETSEVPRTRVYDAVRVLESKGLVETQHSSPQVFRAVPIEEAVTTLRTEYIERTSDLQRTLSRLEPTDDRDSEEVTHEVWALRDEQAIAGRAQQLIDGASEEVILVVGHASVFTDALASRLREADERGVDVLLGTTSAELRATVEESLLGAEVFVSGLEWLRPAPCPEDRTEISRLLLADREAILVSSLVPSEEDGGDHERAVFGRGFDNGLVAIVRRLMTTGLGAVGDPERSADEGPADGDE